MSSVRKYQGDQRLPLYQFPMAEMGHRIEELIEEALEVREILPEEPAPSPSSTPSPFAALAKEPAPEENQDFLREMALKAARQEAEEILEQAREQAKAEAEAAFEKAKEDGYSVGYALGLTEGEAKAEEKCLNMEAEKLDHLASEVARFMERGNLALDKQLADNRDEMRELAITVAEKVIATSIRSSSEVVSRMIQAAVDKRKKREWVRIYVAESAGQAINASPALTAALSGISDQVKIIPMDDDDPGMCIIEMPDEIVDASATTQLNNIRTLLSDLSYDDPSL